MEDNINHPKHYELDKIECIDAMEMTQGRGAVMSFCLCNAFKYLWRHDRKNGLEDIKKAKWYLDKYIELAEKSKAEINEKFGCKEERHGVKGLDSVDIFADAARLMDAISADADRPTELIDTTKELEDLFRADLNKFAETGQKATNGIISPIAVVMLTLGLIAAEYYGNGRNA